MKIFISECKCGCKRKLEVFENRDSISFRISSIDREEVVHLDKRKALQLLQFLEDSLR